MHHASRIALFIVLLISGVIGVTLYAIASLDNSPHNTPNLNPCGVGGYSFVDGWLVIPDADGSVAEERSRFAVIGTRLGYAASQSQDGDLVLIRNDVGLRMRFEHLSWTGTMVMAKAFTAKPKIKDATCSYLGELWAIGTAEKNEYAK